MTLALVVAAVLLATSVPLAAQDAEFRTSAGAWQVVAERATPSGNRLELHDVRLASPTTYVIAREAWLTSDAIGAYDATLHSGDWSLTAAEIAIEPALDIVQIRKLRTDAPANKARVSDARAIGTLEE